MKLTTKGRYGLRALIDLAVHEGSSAVSTQSIAERQQISESYLEQLLRSLKKAGLVGSIRGAGGGYYLLRPAAQISVGDILRALEGNIDAVSCPAIGDAPGAETGACAGSDWCVTKYVWKRINDAINEAVDSIMLDQLVNESRMLMEQNGDEVIPCQN